MHNRLLGDKKTVPSIIGSNSKINSFKQLINKSPIVIDGKLKQKIIFQSEKKE